ncbi:MAG: DUF5615 family PIN-like protein [Ardenticatenaceae bacterium]|nr:DUF5615 family PIN-like protein [Ardenticatenaceae bacterium]
MKFKTDENLPVQAAEMLRNAGYDALTILEQDLGGEADSDIAVICQAEGRIIVTLDLDFADIRAYPPADYPGIIVLRLQSQAKPHVLQVLQQLIKALAFQPVSQQLWIVDERRIRVRE